jgi:membrane-bound lytic murein transglycosylase B
MSFVKKMCWSVLFALASIILLDTAFGKPQQTWSQFVAGVRTEALAQGIRPEVFDRAFRNIHAPNRRVLHFDRTQPEKRLTFLKYRNTRASKARIIYGRRYMKKYAPLLNEISHKYGVSKCFITSLWGLETSYGRFMGNFPVIKSLATLAYNSRRAPFFRKQLFYALHILNGDHVALKDFKGEWAGASGQPQFLPSSWHNYAVDYNGDGRKDIWNTHSDVFASIANYLVKHGWKTGQPWAIKVTTPRGFDEDLMTREVTKTVGEWAAMGVKPAGRPFPNRHLKASIIRPYGGPTFMIFNNFKVIMRWNRSTYYAGTVGYMAEQVCRKEL